MSIEDNKTILILAAGTGGHVFPALAVAEKFRDSGYKIVWLGTKNGLEADLVPKYGFQLHFINVGGVRGKNLLTKVLAPFRIFLGFLQALKLIIKFNPKLVVGMGGYISGPAGIAAWILGKPLVIHEQNSIPGLTNKLLSKFATRVLTGFPNVFTGSDKVFVTGNPVRRTIMESVVPEFRFKDRLGPIRLLILGGSLGAKALNALVPRALALMAEGKRPLIWHQSGRAKAEITSADYKSLGVSYFKIEEFISDMAAALQWADLVLCRAGALTIAELTTCGVGSILVPFPYAVDDHQFYNGLYLSENGAAILLQEANLSAEKLAQILTNACEDRQQLFNMAQKSKTLAYPDPTNKVVDLCLEVIV